jgi:hypothetical protein
MKVANCALEITTPRPDRRRRCGTELQQRILNWYSAEGAGIPGAQCVKLIGVNAVRQWQRAREVAAADGSLE